MTFPGSTTFPGADTFPSSSDYVPESLSIPYFSVGAWSTSGVDADGALWKLWRNSITGWDEPPPVKGGATARSNADGSFDGPVYNDDRVVGWTGSVLAPDRIILAKAKATLSQVARALRAGADLVGHMDDGDYSVRAKRASGWNVAEMGWLGWQYQAVVTCADPYKYGLAVSAVTALPSPGPGGLVFPLFDGTGFLEFGASGNTGQVTLTNVGTAETYETFVVTGPVLGGLVITDVATGRRIVYADDVPMSGVLTIDPTTGHADLNGADRTGRLTVKQWWNVPDGVASTVQFATLGPPGQSGFLTVTLRPAYE